MDLKKQKLMEQSVEKAKAETIRLMAEKPYFVRKLEEIKMQKAIDEQHELTRLEKLKPKRRIKKWMRKKMGLTR